MGMAGIPSTVVAIAVVYTTSKEGHMLADLFRYYKYKMITEHFISQYFRKIKDCLEEIKMSEAKTLSVEESVHLGVLIGRFSNPCPIMPLNLFNLNLRTAASMAGLALTYMLVLLKFRFGDTSNTNDQVNLMSNATLEYLISALKNNTVSVT